jgi:TonB family protein
MGDSMRIFLILCLVAATCQSAAANCEPPHYDTGKVWESSKSKLLMTVSIKISDFAPQRLVCLAEAFKQKYADLEHIDILVFSSLDAARYWLPFQADSVPTSKKHGKAYDSYWFFARQLHALYSYHADKREEYILIKPLGSHKEGPYDTRIILPPAATPHCRFEIYDRCLLALEDIEYPVEPLKAKASGMVTLAGTVARDGKMTRIQVAKANTSSAEWKDLFVREAVNNLKTWRLEAAEHKDSVRITYTYSMDSSLRYPGQVQVDLALPNEVRIRGRTPD